MISAAKLCLTQGCGKHRFHHIHARMAHSSPVITTTKISSHLQLRKLETAPTLSEMRGKTQSLVLFFPWLYASKAAIDKYCGLYHSRGFDVLSVSCEMRHFLWPATGKNVARELLNYLVSNEVPMNTDNFFVHSTSIGAYVYTLVLMEMATNNKYGSVANKIVGQVFDSITVGGLNRMSTGIANNASNVIAQGMIKQGANLYFALTRPWTVKLYEKSIEHFKHSPLKSPSLFYYALNDSMCDADELDAIVESWKNERGRDVHVKCWERSKHALHLREHPQQYSDTLEAFLNHVGLHKYTGLESKL